MPVILFAVPALWDEYHAPLTEALSQAGIAAHLVAYHEIKDQGGNIDPSQVDYILTAPTAPLVDYAPFTRAKLVQNLWAGVERITGNATLTQPLSRMADPGLTEGMVEWVVGHSLRHHLGLDRYTVNPDRIWDPTCPPLARERKVAMLGLGVLGLASARALKALNFNVTGWSRTPKDIKDFPCEHGEDGLRRALKGADIVVTLLPKTPETENVLNAETLALLAPGAAVLNPGRGPLIDDEALLYALDHGTLGHAALDVFRVEPLPKDHPFWAHPKVTVTPHVAADTRAATASVLIAENIRRGEAGESFLHLVDRVRGY
ncbi:glyoxylate/hydroxypyruvate reductase A [Xinfangfangia sp. CPCC 101601]|uniref:Glyoxylate/hydroxypyruvate reductase A n=1 Tax=Pseudogemmobacter lacusdianii TaxID=3069608 RepID=A0ABU0W1K2_9RHOB|nr:glyoxylate/hydroxypyruvate reductase A [Xinfangfangia sp. CPCC 101601]MDQ2067300.1 glyoxylate/hydroxypyruvate reductase A [Xinfangfangia sp. CPCC 101601]